VGNKNGKIEGQKLSLQTAGTITGVPSKHDRDQVSGCRNLEFSHFLAFSDDFLAFNPQT
jgi:hypothetical protein